MEQSFKEHLDSVDLLDLIKEELEITDEEIKCPFCNTGRLIVSDDKNIFKCLNCSEGGNAFDFVKKFKGFSTEETLKHLNIKIKLKKKEVDLQRYYDLNNEAGKYFYNKLMKNETPLKYFKKRKIKVSTIDKFGLGYALDEWEKLKKYLLKKGYTKDEMEAVGLIVKTDKGTTYDRFRNRMMFPIFDINWNIIGFGGRVLDDSKPKYLNSPETLIFHKGENLYGLNFALKKGLNERKIIVVEGYMDCIALHQNKITNVVATLGTALTENHAKLLKDYVDTIILSFDSDEAGQNAVRKGIEILKNEGFEVKILKVPHGKDPDEFIKIHGREAFLNLIENTIPLEEFLINQAEEGLDLRDNAKLIPFIKQVCKIIKDSPNKLSHIEKISNRLGLEQSLFSEII